MPSLGAFIVLFQNSITGKALPCSDFTELLTLGDAPCHGRIPRQNTLKIALHFALSPRRPHALQEASEMLSKTWAIGSLNQLRTLRRNASMHRTMHGDRECLQLDVAPAFLLNAKYCVSLEIRFSLPYLVPHACIANHVRSCSMLLVVMLRLWIRSLRCDRQQGRNLFGTAFDELRNLIPFSRERTDLTRLRWAATPGGCKPSFELRESPLHPYDDAWGATPCDHAISCPLHKSTQAPLAA